MTADKEVLDLLRKIAHNTSIAAGLPDYDPEWGGQDRKWGMSVISTGGSVNSGIRHQWSSWGIIALLALVIVGIGSLVIFGLGGRL